MWQTDSFFGPWKLGAELARVTLDTQAVVAMRVAGMMGLWTVSGRENARMIEEKPKAMVKAAFAVQRAVLEGQSPDQVMRAGLKPIAKKVGKNARRLSAKGPRRADD